jgi:hypothetical protein
MGVSFPVGADAPQLQANWSVLSEAEGATASALLAAGQAHLFSGWPPAGERDADKKRLLAQARGVEARRGPAGRCALATRELAAATGAASTCAALLLSHAHLRPLPPRLASLCALPDGRPPAAHRLRSWTARLGARAGSPRTWRALVPCWPTPSTT